MDKSFTPDLDALQQAMQLLFDSTRLQTDSGRLPVTLHNAAKGAADTVLKNKLSQQLPKKGIGERATLDSLAPIVFDGAARLGSDTAFAHMDPPTPWITWVMHCWNASLNQNLLHPDVSPVAGQLEDLVLQWLTPFFGMAGGHLTPGSTVSNLTALWAARDLCGVTRVVASAAAHISIDKAARILGLELIKIPCTAAGALDRSLLPTNMQNSVLVLTAGTTSEGAVDALALIGQAAWTHVDAAWAGPLRFSPQYKSVLAGIERADSIALSAHKWLYQPKECGVLMFRDVVAANEVLSTTGAYLSRPNVGLLGSHGATAVPLLATLIAWGLDGLAQRIESGMQHADLLVAFLRQQEDVVVFNDNVCGVVLWRCTTLTSEQLVNALPPGAASLTTINGMAWVRHVSANPNIDMHLLKNKIGEALRL